MARKAIQSDPIRRCFGKYRMNHSYLSVPLYSEAGQTGFAQQCAAVSDSPHYAADIGQFIKMSWGIL
jgi:hypothetical protein